MRPLENLRLLNRARVVDVLRTHSFTSRSELARLTGLSRATVASVVAELLALGLIVERRPAGDGVRPGRGRPPALLSLHAAAGAAVGISFGRERLHVAVSDLSSSIVGERSAAVDGSEPAAAVALVEEVLGEAGVCREQVVGVAAGHAGETTRVARVDLRDELSRRLGLPVDVASDANLAALGEVSVGAGRGCSDVVYVLLSDAVRAGLVLRGRLFRGARGAAGELGHVQVAPDGELCRCGRRGCLETVASAGAVLRLLRPAHGDALTLADVVRLAAAGDHGCRRVLNDAGRAAGRVLADVCNHLNPSAIVVGGELGAAGAPVVDGVSAAIDRYALSSVAASVEVRAGLLGERAVLLGAISLVVGDTERMRSERLPTLEREAARG